MAIFLLCEPRHYSIEYSINPWMKVENKSNKEKAINQWNNLKNKIIELGAEVKLIEPKIGLPDMVFTANAGLILKNKKDFVASHFTHIERLGEEIWFKNWFSQNGFNVIEPDLFFEGAGDALYLGENLIGGYGFRTNVNFYCGITNYTVKLIDPYFYHLDTCFCPLDDMDYLIYTKAFDENSLNVIRSISNRQISVPEEEAKLFACNSVKIGKNVILPDGCPKTMEMLKENGYLPHPLEMSEFIKSGGACKCLTLNISETTWQS